MRRTFTRRNGETITVEITVDMDKLIEDIARTMVLRDKKRVTKAGGAIVGIIVD